MNQKTATDNKRQRAAFFKDRLPIAYANAGRNYPTETGQPAIIAASVMATLGLPEDHLEPLFAFCCKKAGNGDIVNGQHMKNAWTEYHAACVAKKRITQPAEYSDAPKQVALDMITLATGVKVIGVFGAKSTEWEVTNSVDRQEDSGRATKCWHCSHVHRDGLCFMCHQVGRRLTEDEIRAIYAEKTNYKQLRDEDDAKKKAETAANDHTGEDDEYAEPIQALGERQVQHATVPDLPTETRAAGA